MTDTLERREAIARIIDPTADQLLRELAKPGSEGFPDYIAAKEIAESRWQSALAKADAILALTTSPRVDEGRARELADKARDHVRAGDHRMAYFAMCEAFAAALAATPADPRVGKMEAALRDARAWVAALTVTDMNEIVADGGITAGMVVGQEATEQLRRLDRALSQIEGSGR